tara:strand:- start:1597 stop:2124 length:528 start_codon:yes stop_codon:yes gene_type:complete
MALFGGHRDVALFSKINKELITDIIDTEVYYYKVILDETKRNLYGEGKNKVFYNPIKVPSIIDRGEESATSDEFGSDYTRLVTFSFLRDTMVDKNLYPQIGDVLEWNNDHHIVDVVRANQFFAGKNPETWDGGEGHGYNLSIICETHVVKKSQLKIKDDYRVGTDNSNNDLPIGI